MKLPRLTKAAPRSCGALAADSLSGASPLRATRGEGAAHTIGDEDVAATEGAIHFRTIAMKQIFFLGILALALLTRSVHAADFPVQGFGSSGNPGDRVFVELTYNYGTSFAVIAEDLQFEWQFANMTFVPAASTIDVSGTPQDLVQYATALGTFAQAHQGAVLVNPNAPGSTPDLKGYALSFYTADGTPHVRTGLVRLRLAFDILFAAPQGTNRVSFTPGNVLVDEFENEFRYPTALQNLSVVVPAVGIEFAGAPGLSGGQFRIDFRVTNFRPGLGFLLQRKSDLRDPWTTDSGAILSVVVPDTVFRYVTPTSNAPRGFYRVVMQ
jgi:hypothetical protein